MTAGRASAARTFLLAGIGLIGAGVIIFAHIHVSKAGLAYSGPHLPLAHVYDVAVTLALVAICAALGERALNASGIRFEQPSERLTFGFAVGGGLLGTALLLMGLVGVLWPAAVAAAVGLAAIVARRELRGLAGVLRGLWAELSRGAEPRLALSVAVIVALVASFLLILAMAPPVDWDAQMYHLRIPLQFLETGRVYLPADNLHVAFVGLVQMLYVPLLAAGALAGPALLSAVCALLVGVAMYALGSRFFDARTGLLALALLWGTTTVLLVAITPRTDVTLTFFILLGHHAALRAWNEGERRQLWLAALMFGFALASKYLAIPYLAALSPFIVWAAYRCAADQKRTVANLAGFAALLLAVTSPWLLKNWLLIGAPLYPLLAETRLEPWLVPFFGSPTIGADLTRSTLQVIAASREPFDLIAAFFAPSRITIEFEGAFHYLNPVLLALPLWVLVIRDRALAWLIVPAVGYLLILLIPFANTNLRYLIPAAIPLTIAAARILVAASDRFLTRRTVWIATVPLLAVALYSSGRAMYLWLAHTQALAHAAGPVSAAEYIDTHLDPSVRTLARVRQFVDESTSAWGILMLWESRALYFEQPVIADPRASNWPLLAEAPEPIGCLGELGISHVLVSSGALQYYTRRGVDPQAYRWDDFVGFANRCLGEPIYQGAAFLLFERI